MSSSFKPIWVIFAVIVAIAGVSAVSRLMAPREIVGWGNDFTAAQAGSTANGKPLLAYFTASWCGPCQKMKSSTFADPEVKKALERFSAVKIDIDQHADLARQFHVDSIPAFFILSADGNILAADGGYKSSEEFLAWLAKSSPTTRPAS